MLHRFAVIAIVALALLAGCGAGRDTSREAAAKEAGKPAAADLAAAEATTTPVAGTTTTPVASAAGTKPGVDTSQLRPAPAWSLVDLAGNTVESAQFKGKVVIVDFWATWCGPCRKGIPELNKLYAAYKDKGVEIVGVSLDQQGPGVVKPFVAQFKMNYPVLMGTQKIVNDFGGVTGIPTAFVISQDGKVYKKYVGLYPGSVYEQDIKTLLGS
jgi:thiol-disulfide isomerase/thioredoxin